MATTTGAVMTDEAARERADPVAYVPSARITNWVLTERTWDGLPELMGVVTAPILRPDGSILQASGYDPLTRYWLQPELEIEVPEAPSGKEKEDALHLILDEVLRDFPWGSPAAKANSVAAMFTPHLRPYLDDLSPLFLINASQPGTGKGLLCDIIGTPYGQTKQTLPDGQETRKTITSILGDTTAPVITLDNVERTLKSPELAAVLTMRYWSGRLLSQNKIGTYPNDRTWLANGNQLATAGDMTRRCILVDLDYPLADPENRTGFQISDMYSWLAENRGRLLRAQLILMRAWVLAGARRDESQVMGSFTPWACAMGGFLQFCGIEGFRANAAQMQARDQGGGELGAFFRAWRPIFGNRPVLARAAYELATGPDDFVLVRMRDAKAPGKAGQNPDLAMVTCFRAAYPGDRNGRPLKTIGLGRYLSSKAGRWAGGFTLRAATDEKTGDTTYAVLSSTEAEAGPKL